MPTYHLATFRTDVTPPLGHPLCGGWILPARTVDDPLRGLGVVLLGMGQPVVLYVLDWVAIRNEAFRTWRAALAAACHTVPERVSIHCVHQHNAPFADTEAQRLVEAARGAPANLDLKFFDRVVKESAAAAKEALGKTAKFTHYGVGKAKVDQVASNRRVLGPDGKVKWTRTSATRSPEAREAPEGLIDPWLKTLSFWDGDKPLAALHYYATHPMSYYGDGRVSADFCGLARQKMQDQHPGVFQMYFTGCAGNVTAGKYNDGAHENRPVLRDRIHAGMSQALRETQRHPVEGWSWRVEPVLFQPRSEKTFTEEQSRADLADEKGTPARRGNAAFQLAWLKRINTPIELTCLDLGKAQVVHLPGEPFIEYQLKAQELRRDSFVCVAGYGDDGTGYIPTRKAYFEGGYEPTVALAAPCEERLYEVIGKLVKG